MKYILRIELLSDACIGNGTGNGLSVDLDVCTENGIPYIPAKRIKGLFKDAAKEYSDNIEKIDIDNLFGLAIASGENKNMPGKLFFGDGNIKGYKDSYVTTRTQIAIDKESGITRDGSLRYINVVNKGTVFESLISIYEDDVDDEKLFEIVKLIKHIGVSRNRGFGLVKCRLTKEKEEANKIKVADNSNNQEFDLKIKINNVEPLLIASNNKDVSLPYIPATTILGFFANDYALKHDLSNKESQEYKLFSELFLENKIQFTDAFISNSNYDEFIPTPNFILRLKNKDESKNNKYLNMLEDAGQNLAKKAKLNGSYVNLTSINKDNEYIEVKYPVFEYNYHLAKTSKDKEFFQYQSLSKNQYFVAKVLGDNDLINKFISELTDIAYFGKSKNSQYGMCKLEFEKVKKNKNDGKFNLIVFDKFTPVELLNLDNVNSTNEEIKSYSIDIKPKGGYNLLWNLPKLDSNYVTPGSYILFNDMLDSKDLLDKYGNILNYVKVFDSKNLFKDKYEEKLENSKESNNGDPIKNKAFEYVYDKKAKIALNSTQISLVLDLIKKYDSFYDLDNALKRMDHSGKSIKEKRPVLYETIIKLKNGMQELGLDINSNEQYKTFFKTTLELYKYEKR